MPMIAVTKGNSLNPLRRFGNTEYRRSYSRHTVMKIFHKLVASFVGVSLLTSVVSAVALADNGYAIPEIV
ncbi:MAG: hypothetical protein V7K89_03005 [Nostoc sp.]|uniref:hypothetical protein n=1 Tax=Nostoc sp. TaxID=1180 RepID=UPI002FFC766C